MKHYRYILIFLLGCFGLQSQNLSTPQPKVFEDFIAEEIKQGNIAGGETYVLKNKEVAWHTSLGYSDLNSQSPLAKNSIYYIQSMTKPIISTAIMQLVEQGKLSLDDHVEKYIPEVSQLRVTRDPEKGVNGPTIERKSEITVRQLLTHTAGFSHGLGNSKLDQELFVSMYNETLNFKGHKNLESRITALLKAPLIGQPGEQWYYSASPDLLALILQRVSKQTISDYLKTHLFDPIGMVDTGYNLNKEQALRVAKLHTLDEDGNLILSEQQVPTQGNTVYGGTHGLYSTVKDYARFCQVFLQQGRINGHRILQPETVEMMTSNQTQKLMGESRGFGLGFGVLYNTDKDPSPAANGQFYWGGYFRTHFFVDPEQDIIALFMSQKLPYSDDYMIALNRYVYSTLGKEK
jgi:CubicO group peptidase (beta-lactamase class C family)